MPERSVTVRIRSLFDRSGVDQFKRGMREADTAAENMGNQADDTATKTDSFGNALKGAFTIGLAFKIAQVGVQMYNVGTAVNQTKERFEELIAPLGDAEETMARLRDATLGIATDTEIQTGANLLLSMGLADSPEELEGIIGLITRLKKPTTELGDAIDDFSKLLANNSVLRLDNFGISSARVRVRMQELLETGQALDREDAFKLATLEEGRRSVERLGSAAENASTPVARLQTSLENLFNQASGNLAAGVEGIAGIAEIALGQHPEQLRQAEEMARVTAENMNRAMTDALIRGQDQSGLSSDFVSNYMSTAFDLAQRNPELLNDIEMFTATIFNTMDQGLRTSATGVFDPFAFDSAERQQAVRDMAALAAETTKMAQAERELAAQQEASTMAAEDARIEHKGRVLIMQDLTRATFGQLVAEEELAAKEEKINQQNKAERLAREAQEMENLTRATFRQFVEEENLIELQNRQAESRIEELRRQQDMVSSLGDLEQSAITEGFRLFEGMSFQDTLPDFMTQEQADNIRDMADEAERLASELEDAAREAPGLISEAEIENARNTADAVSDMADEAERAAAAFENIKLSDIFGQTNGGTLGEINRLILDQFQGSDEQRAALERQLALTSGQETQGSLFLQEIIAPAIADAGDDPELAAQMASKINDILLNAALAGVDTNNEDFLAQLQEQIGDVGLLGIDSAALVEDFATMDENLTTMSDNATITAEQSTIMSEAVQASAEPSGTLADNSGIAADSMEAAATAASKLEKTMLALTSKVHKIKAQIDVSVTGDDISGLVEKAVKNNGGKVPGAVDS